MDSFNNKHSFPISSNKKNAFSTKSSSMEIGSKSTHISSKLNIYENNQTNNSTDEREENRYKIQYYNAKKEEKEFERSKYERSISLKINIKRKISKNPMDYEIMNNKINENINDCHVSEKNELLDVLKNKKVYSFFSFDINNIKKKSKSINKIRKDSFGNVIIKDRKNHKVNFIDLLKENKKGNLVHTIDIKSYKIQNKLILKDEDKVNCECNLKFCLIF